MLFLAYFILVLYFFFHLTKDQSNTDEYTVSLAAAVAFPVYVVGQLINNYLAIYLVFASLLRADILMDFIQQEDEDIQVLGEG